MKSTLRFTLCLAVTLLCIVPVHSQQTATQPKQDINVTIDKLYEIFIPMLDRVDIVGGGPIGNELKSRWGQVVNHIKSNKGSMTEEVKQLLMTPGGVPLDFESITKYIQLDTSDSITRIKLNPDALFEEIKVARQKLVQAAKEAARTK